MKLKYVNLTDFKQTNYRYNDTVSPNCNYSNYRGGTRITFRLPNNLRDFYYNISDDISGNAKNKNCFIQEFEALLRNGLFPEKSISKLPLTTATKTPSEMGVIEAIRRYYDEYCVGKRQKSAKTVYYDGTTLEYIMNHYFIGTLGIKHASEIDTDVLVKFNRNVELWKKKGTTQPLTTATIATYKKLVKAFVNCLIDHNKIDKSECDTTKIVTTVYVKGKPSPQACSRLIYIPKQVIEAVRKCSYKTPPSRTDTKKLFLFMEQTGLRKTEALTLSVHNLYPSVEDFNAIKIFDKLDCPTEFGDGFTVKSERGNRTIDLSEESIQFVKDQLHKHKNHKIYGTVGKLDTDTYKLVEYRFLFPRYDFKLQKWLSAKTFNCSFHSLIDLAIEKANLTDSGEYRLHDLRRSLNLILRDEAEFRGDQAAYILGHSDRTNEKNYLSTKSYLFIIEKQTSPKMRAFLDSRKS